MSIWLNIECACYGEKYIQMHKIITLLDKREQLHHYRSCAHQSFVVTTYKSSMPPHDHVDALLPNSHTEGRNQA